MRRWVWLTGCASALLWVLLLPGAAAAFPLTSCQLGAVSHDASGATISQIKNGGQDATQDKPFLVDWDGTVSYIGTTAPLTIKNHTWHVDVFGIPTPLRGGDPNSGGDQGGNGTVGVSANAPFRFTGLYYVSGEIRGEGGSCEGSGWFKLLGDPVGTIPFLVGIGALIIGGLLLVAAVATAGAVSATAAIVGGLLAGVGVAVLVVIYSIAPVGSATPVAVLLLGLLVGLITWFLARERRRRLTGVSRTSPGAV